MGVERHEKRITTLVWILAACVLVWVVSRGFTGPARRLDARAVILGGICWTKGISPYVVESYASAWQLIFHEPRPQAFVFAYPPTIALLLVPLAWLGLQSGLLAIDVLNLVTLGFVLFGCVYLVRSGADVVPWLSTKRALGLAFAASVGPISATLLLGQTGLWALGGMIGLWALPKRFRAARVLCVVIATTKPTLALPVLCFVAVTEPALMAVAAGLSLLLCAPLLLATGGFAVIGQWLGALKQYAAIPANSPLELASAQHLLFRFVPGLPPAILTVLSAIAGLALGFRARALRSPESGLESWLLLVALSAALLPLHTYDLILIAPLAAAIPFARGSSRYWYPAAVLVAARPAAFAQILEKLGFVFGYAAPFVAAVGTSLIAIGACIHLLTGRSVLSDEPSTLGAAVSPKAA